MPNANRLEHVNLHWILESQQDGSPVLLTIVIPPGFPAAERAALERARTLTDQRSGGWRAARPSDQGPFLPWHWSLSPAEHAWMWVKLLSAHALAPDLTGPRIDRE